MVTVIGHPYLDALVGGLVIGAAASVMLVVNGRIAGCSGIVGGVIHPKMGEFGWRAAFVAGLVAGGALMLVLYPASMPTELAGSIGKALVAGLLVGVGTSMGSGCTSGHGICGISRMSPRSMTATGTFMLTGAVIVWAVGQFGWA